MLIMPNRDQKIEMMIIQILKGLKAERKGVKTCALGHSINYRNK